MRGTPAPKPGPNRVRKLTELSAARQALVRLCQSIDYGKIIELQIRHGEPVFSPAPTVRLELNLDTDCTPRPEAILEDFALREEVCRLLDQIDALHDGSFERIEVRAGIPRRVVFDRRLAEVPL